MIPNPQVESNVDKASRLLGEWRASEAKAICVH